MTISVQQLCLWAVVGCVLSASTQVSGQPRANCPNCPQSDCTLPSVTGPCRALFHCWYYNVRSGRCERFIYGGCHGNGNRYCTRQACERKCRKRPAWAHAGGGFVKPTHRPLKLRPQ